MPVENALKDATVRDAIAVAFALRFHIPCNQKLVIKGCNKAEEKQEADKVGRNQE